MTGETTRGGSRTDGELEPFTFMFCGGQDDLPGLALSLLSTAKSADPRRPCTLVFLDAGMEDSSYSELENRLGQITQAREAPHSLVRVRIPERPPTPEETAQIGRWHACQWDQADSVIWVDNAVLVTVDFERFLPTDPNRVLITGCQDSIVGHLNYDCPIPEEERKVDEYGYFNASVLWLHTKEMRSQSFASQLTAFQDEHAGNMKFGDQTALNALTVGKKEIMPAHFNRRVDRIPLQDVAGCIENSVLNLGLRRRNATPTAENLKNEPLFWMVWNRLLRSADDSEWHEHLDSLQVSSAGKSKAAKAKHKALFYGLIGKRAKAEKWRARHLELSFWQTQTPQSIECALADWLG